MDDYADLSEGEEITVRSILDASDYKIVQTANVQFGKSALILNRIAFDYSDCSYAVWLTDKDDTEYLWVDFLDEDESLALFLQIENDVAAYI